MLNKDISIRRMLARLARRLGCQRFDIVDHWEIDLCAIGIASPRNHGVLVYISTYRKHPTRYDVELELPPTPGNDFPYEVASRHSNLTFEELVRVVRAHLAWAG